MSGPAAGWYDDPHGEGTRYWDGVVWTGYHRGVQDSPAVQVAHPNPRAIAWSALFGVVSYVALLVILLPRLERDPAYNVGGLFVPVAVAATAVALIGRSTSRRLGWWVFAITVPAAAVGLSLLLYADDLRTAAANTASRGPSSAALSVPGAGDGWVVLDTAETRGEVQRITQGLRTEVGGDIDSVVAEFYTDTDSPDSPVLFVGINGELDRSGSAGASVANMLRGGFVDETREFDPGEGGGALGCGQAAAQGLTWVTCAWVGNRRAVLVRWNDQSVDLPRAADLTRDLRDRAAS